MSVFYLNKTSSFQIQCAGSLQRCPCRNVLTVANTKCYQVHHCSCLSLKCHGKRLFTGITRNMKELRHLCAGWIRTGKRLPRKGLRFKFRRCVHDSLPTTLLCTSWASWMSLRITVQREVGRTSCSCKTVCSSLMPSLKQNWSLS